MKVYLLYTVESFVTRGKIPHDEQCLLLQHCFQKSSVKDASKMFSLCRKLFGLYMIVNDLLFLIVNLLKLLPKLKPCEVIFIKIKLQFEIIN